MLLRNLRSDDIAVVMTKAMLVWVGVFSKHKRFNEIFPHKQLDLGQKRKVVKEEIRVSFSDSIQGKQSNRKQRTLNIYLCSKKCFHYSCNIKKVFMALL